MNPRYLTEYLVNSDSARLESLLGEMLSRQGWKTHVTQQSWDGGVDVYGYYPRANPVIRVGFDTKRYDTSSISPKRLAEWADDLTPEYPIDRFCIVVTTNISDGVKRMARDRDVDLIALKGLTHLLGDSADDLVLCSQYQAEMPPSRDLTATQLQARLAALDMHCTLDACKAVLKYPHFDELIYSLEQRAVGNIPEETISQATLPMDNITTDNITPLLMPRPPELSVYPFSSPHEVYSGGGTDMDDKPWATVTTPKQTTDLPTTTH